MLFDFRFTIPANTPKEKAFKKILDLAPAVITRIEVAFPAGCKTLVHVQIFHENFQLVPINPGASLAWDDRVYVDHPYYPLEIPLTRLLFRAWNEDTKYDHTINVTIEMQPHHIAFPERRLEEAMQRLYEYMRKAFGI